MGKPVRTRFAPSPTGLLHVGGARTALFSWLFAKRHSGSFVIRIEDTDIERSRKEFEEEILKDLEWLGLDWDEGPDKGGVFGPYRQSERILIYQDHAKVLLENGEAYYCCCSNERLEELKSQQLKKGLPPRYDNRCREFIGKPVPKGEHPLRFRMPAGKIAFNDAVHGEVSFDSSAIGDFVIVGSDNIASYNFAVVVDDALMSITHVVRGDDHIPNTPRQIAIYRSLGFEIPKYAHLPLVLAPDRSVLSKRHKSSSIGSLKEDGFLPEAIVNSIARLGWSAGEELLSLGEMAEKFSLEAISKSPSVFDIERLRSYNKKAIDRMGAKEIAALIHAQFMDIDGSWLEEAAEAVKPNAATLGELEIFIKGITGEAGISDEAKAALSEPLALKVLDCFLKGIENEKAFDEGSFDRIMAEAKKSGAKGKMLFAPIRAALTGSLQGIELHKILKLLGREEAEKRVKKIIQG